MKGLHHLKKPQKWQKSWHAFAFYYKSRPEIYRSQTVQNWIRTIGHILDQVVRRYAFQWMYVKLPNISWITRYWYNQQIINNRVCEYIPPLHSTPSLPEF